jgi:broad-specificity NMP kinase
MDPAHALWIGGPQGSGKSSIAGALADRFGLQVYHVDARTWVHEARMPATEFASLTMDERWVYADVHRMLEWFVTHSRHRFRLVLEDLQALPDEPACIVEGPQLFPTSVSAVLDSPDQALFLLPVPAEMEARLRARGPMEGTSDGARARENAVARDLLIAQAFEREARELRLPAVAVDRPLDEMIEVAASCFGPAVERLPRGGDLGAVRAFEEEVRRTQIRLYHEWLERATAAGGRSR